MLEQQKEPHRAFILPIARLEEQIGFAFPQGVVDEGAVDEPEAIPMDLVRDVPWQGRAEQVGGFRGIGEDGAEQPVMGVFDFSSHT